VHRALFTHYWTLRDVVITHYARPLLYSRTRRRDISYNIHDNNNNNNNIMFGILRRWRRRRRRPAAAEALADDRSPFPLHIIIITTTTTTTTTTIIQYLPIILFAHKTTCARVYTRIVIYYYYYNIPIASACRCDYIRLYPYIIIIYYNNIMRMQCVWLLSGHNDTLMMRSLIRVCKQTSYVHGVADIYCNVTFCARIFMTMAANTFYRSGTCMGGGGCSFVNSGRRLSDEPLCYGSGIVPIRSA